MIELVDYKKALEICKKYHYTKTLPQSSKYNFYFSGEGWEGVICYGTGANRSMNKFNYLELLRCAFSPKPKEIKTSKLIIECDKYLFNKVNIDGLISYYDKDLQANKNDGMLYLYSRYKFCGLTPKSGSYTFDGKYVHKRTLGNKYKQNNINNVYKNEFDYALKNNYLIHFQQGKKRFVKINKTKQNIILPDFIKNE